LPLAREACRSGLAVSGFDISLEVVEGLAAGRSHVDDLSDADVREMLEAGFSPSTDDAVIGAAEVVVICVPTPLSPEGGPDLGAVVGATRAVAARLRPGQTVILESTSYPGTTDELVRPLLEEGGLVAGVDFHLAFSPERVDPGNPTYGIRNTPKVVGGHTARCGERARDFYADFVDTVVLVGGTREAEMAKLLENTFRHVNIALVNEMAKFCHDLDIDLWEVIRAAASKPFGFMPFFPGPGVGGHCIPIDPNYLSFTVQTKLGYPFRLVELSQEINQQMPVYVARRAQDLLNEAAKAMRGSTILLLGVTYKPNIADERESPAVPLAKVLMHNGATVLFHDPLVKDWTQLAGRVARVDDLEEAVAAADLTILLQNHTAYDVDALAARSQSFLDTRGTVTTGGAVQRL
jgi:nucleotide sugar dehydrogenase